MAQRHARSMPGEPPKSSLTPTDEALLASLDFELEPARLAVLYQAGLFLVAIAMLVLPVLYVALIGLLGFGVWYHATENVDMLVGSWIQLRFLGYVTPIIGGATGALFMVKPLFAPRIPTPPRRTLRRDEEPLLYAYVDRLCRVIGAPPPRRIDVDMEVNASASFRRGFLSFFGKDLVLTIGLPLVGGFNLREFTGVLAHEFGHFTQGAAMRLTYFINTVNAWFARVVYQRDAWDRMLEQWAATAESTYGQAILGISKLFVWLSRRVLWTLMMVGHGVSSFMSRQMEFNADGYQARVSGSTTFRETHLRLPLLEAAMGEAHNHLGQMWQERRLVDDLVALVRDNAVALDRNRTVAERIAHEVLTQKTGILDTHPSPKDRIDRVAALDFGGAVSNPTPASDLFVDFHALSAAVTLEFYRQQVDGSLAERNLVSTERALATRAEVEAGTAALTEYFLGIRLVGVGVFPTDRVASSGGITEVTAALEAARALMYTRLTEASEDLTQLIVTGDERARLGMGLCLSAAGLKLEPAEWGLTTGDRVELRQLWSTAVEECDQARERLVPAIRAASARLYAALRVAIHPDMRDAFADSTVTISNLLGLADSFAGLERIWPQLSLLTQQVSELGYLASRAEGNQGNQDFQQKGAELIEAVGQSVTAIAEAVGETPYPYDHAEGPVSLRRYLAPEGPAPDAPVIDAGADLVDRVGTLYNRMWGELATLVLRVEVATAPPHGAGTAPRRHDVRVTDDGPSLVATADHIERVHEGLCQRFPGGRAFLLAEGALLFRATDPVDGQAVVVKVPALWDAEWVNRFRREIEILSSLHHPNIVPLRASGSIDDVPYYVTPYMEGEWLSERLTGEHHLPIADIIPILLDVAKALEYCHRVGVVHRDVNPESMRLTERGTVLEGFFFAKAAKETGLVGTGLVLGRPNYMSPEAARGQEVDGRSDLYSLGVVAYQCMTGSVPFDGADAFSIGYKHIMEEPQVPQMTTRYEKAFYAVVSKLLAKDPGDRFASAGDLAVALETVAT